MTAPAQAPFNRHSIVPIYIQIADALLEQINAGLLKPDDKLPSEAELREELERELEGFRQQKLLQDAAPSITP